MMLNAEIISVGTEIILGNIVNTHARFLSQELAVLGINVYYHISVGDNNKRLIEVVNQAMSRSNLIVFTGGLGPTADDMTRQTLYQALGICSQELGDAASDAQGVQLLQNDYGTAPGYLLQRDQITFVLLPGPPRELEPMFLQYVKPYLQARTKQTICSKIVHVVGIGEPELENKLGDMLETDNPTAALYVKTGEIQIRVTAKASDASKAERLIDQKVSQIAACLGDEIYGIDAVSLPHTLVQKLTEQAKKIAVAESCTGGLLAARITSVAGASNVFDMGLVTYSNEVKHKLLDVQQQTLEQFGAVSEQVAVQMAKGLAKQSGADYNIAVTGIAGPGGGTAYKPVGTVYIALEHDGKVWCEKYTLARRQKEREYIRELAALYAMNMVRLALAGQPKYADKFVL